jgi:hypothetical protein
MFTTAEKKTLLERLPTSLELSYESKLHKKVPADLFWVIPKGQKCLVWYTYLHDENVCLLIYLNERGNYSDVKLFPSVFSSALALGTILYGTFFFAERQPFFTCEQIHYYKGTNLQKQSVESRLTLMFDLFTKTQIGQVAYTPEFLIVGLPVIADTYEAAEAVLNTLPYRTYGIGAYRFKSIANKTAPSASMPTSPSALPSPTIITSPTAAIPTMPRYGYTTPMKGIFKVKADLAADIYHLYCADNIYYTTVAVSSYKMSTTLNALFRNIKENANLDLLEESDDEGEFENTQIDRFVDLDKTAFIECAFNKKTQKWQLLNVVKNGHVEGSSSSPSFLLSLKDAKQIENK